jgi:antirestriction protein
MIAPPSAAPNRRFPESLKEDRVPSPRIYVACLSSYNAGQLFGKWIELADIDDVEQLQQAIAAMLQESPQPRAEEWAIHDHEGFDGIDISEHERLERLVSIAGKLASAADPSAVVAAIQAFGEEWEKALDEGYRGAYERADDYAEEFARDRHREEELGPYAQYIDWSAVERDRELAGDITVVSVSGSRHVFTAF